MVDMTYRKVSAFGIGLALALQLGCGATDITSSDQPRQSSDPSLGIVPIPVEITDLLSCEPQPYLSNTVRIGPKGGKLRVGSHVLAIPAGALDQYVSITGEQITGSTNSVRFGPEGLTFAVPAELTMSYNNCTAVQLPKRIAYTSETLKILEVLPTRDKAQFKVVTGEIDHFSRYAVAF